MEKWTGTPLPEEIHSLGYPRYMEKWAGTDGRDAGETP